MQIRGASCLLASFLAATLLGVLSVSDAQDPAEPTLPLNPFAEAHEGDWCTLSFRSQAPGKTPRYQISTWRVKTVDGDTVTVDYEGLSPGAPKPRISPRDFHRSTPPTVREFCRLKPGDSVDDMKTEDRRFTIDGHLFQGTQLAFKSSAGGATRSFTLLFAKEVKSAAIVSIQIDGPDGEVSLWGVRGFGSKEKTLWGKTADEFPLVEAKPGPDPENQNLYQDAANKFSILAPHFTEIQDRQHSWALLIHGVGGGYSVMIQGLVIEPQAWHDQIVGTYEQRKHKVIAHDLRKVSGKDAVFVEYEYESGPPVTKTKETYRILELHILKGAHVVCVQCQAKVESFAALEKTLRASIANVRLIDVGSSGHKGEEASVYYDHQYGLKLPLPEIGKIKAAERSTLVTFCGAEEVHGLSSRVNIALLAKAVSKKDYKPEGIPADWKVSEPKELKVSGRDALSFELTGAVKGTEVHGLSLVVFDKNRTFYVDASTTKAGWDEDEEQALRASVESFKLDP